MIDIHTHILPSIDDGSKGMEVSINMLEKAVSAGATNIICTPHYRAPYINSAEKIKATFDEFKKNAKDKGIEVNLLLGEEVYMRPDIIAKLNDGQVFTINETKCVLVEFDFADYISIPMVVKQLKDNGYRAVIAHPERYRYIDLETIEDIKRLGGLIQVNATSFMGRAKKAYYKFVKKLLKAGLVDFVASDYHDGRDYNLDKVYEFIKKKFGAMEAEKLFNLNAIKYFNII